MQEPPDNQPLYRALSRLLLIGVVAAIVLMLLGTLGSFAAGQGLPGQAPAFDQVLTQALRLDPHGLLGLGVLVLYFTPIASVIVAIVGFARQRDWFYAGIAAVVLAILTLSAALAGS